MSFSEFFRFFLAPFGTAALLAVAVYICYSSRRVRLWERAHFPPFQFLLALFFGALSILASAAFGKLPLGADAVAFVDAGDLAPLFAGLCGGPIAGIGAGILGALFRYFASPALSLAVSGTLAALLSGIVGSALYYFFLKKVIHPLHGLWIGAATAVLHLAFLLVFITPISVAIDCVIVCSAPLILSNALGLYMCLLIYSRIQKQACLHEID